MLVMQGQRQVASGTFTKANSRLSLVDGTAFFDCGVDLSAYAGLDSGSHEYYLKVYSKSNGASIGGYVGAVGGGAAFGGEGITGWRNARYETFTSNVKDITSAINTAGDADAITNEFAVTGTCYKIITTVTLGSGQPPILYDNGASPAISIGSIDAYWCSQAGGHFDYYNSIASNYSAVCSIKPVTDCAVTGFHIISAQGGSTQNWTSVSGSFNYNDGDGYSYKIYKVR